jgi:hypothetical protein
VEEVFFLFHSSNVWTENISECFDETTAALVEYWVASYIGIKVRRLFSTIFVDLAEKDEQHFRANNGDLYILSVQSLHAETRQQQCRGVCNQQYFYNFGWLVSLDSSQRP